MLERGGFSFVALMVINPVVILLYQNFSFLPVSHAELASREMMRQKRFVSSVVKPGDAEVSNIKITVPAQTVCHYPKDNCPVPDVD